MLPQPPNIRQKVVHQLLGRREHVTFFMVAKMPVVALASLIVVADHPLTGATIQ
jgi:hypothetical protein